MPKGLQRRQRRGRSLKLTHYPRSVSLGVYFTKVIRYFLYLVEVIYVRALGSRVVSGSEPTGSH